MDISVWIAIYLPIFVILFILLPEEGKRQFMRKLIKRKRGEDKMSNNLIISFIGETCNISCGTYGINYKKVKVVEVVDNWMKIEKKNEINLVNIDFI